MKFSKQYKKLDWPVFTTIRQDKGYYRPGQKVPVETPKGAFFAQVVSVQPIKKFKITPELAQFDAESSFLELLSMMENWYGSKCEDYIVITLLNLSKEEEL